jgi:type VI secretion system VgrG family protein
MAQGITTTYRFSVNTLDDATFQVVQFTGEESISKPFRFEFVLASTNPELDIAALVGESATFTITKDDISRPICGIVSDFHQTEETTAGTYLYSAVLVPRLSRLKLSRQNQIYGTMNPVDVIQIVTDELGESASQAGPQRRSLGLSSTDFDVRCTESYPTRDYVVQYSESDFDFVSRQLEHWGIFYFFDHSQGNDRIVLGDNNINFGQIGGPTTVRYAPASIKTAAGETSVTSFGCRVQQIPTEVTLRDYNYRTPKVELVVQQQVDPTGFGWINQYNDHFRNTAEGMMLAKIRAEEFICRKVLYFGNSDCNRFQAGHCFTLSDHFRDQYNQEYLLVSIQHRGAQPVFGVATVGGEMAATAVGYENSFVAIAANTPFRPERLTHRPKISGVMTGRIDGAGDGARAEIDELGRYKVTLQFDLGGYPGGQASQYIRMAQPHAGSNSGMHFPLLAGTEVILTHVDGNPDRPIIIGAVPDAASLIVSNQGSNDRNRIVTTSGCFMQINDGQGSGGGGGGASGSGNGLQAQSMGSAGSSLLAQPSGAPDASGGSGVNAWAAPSGGLRSGGGSGTSISFGEPSNNCYFRMGSYESGAENGLLPRLKCDNQPGGSSSKGSSGSNLMSAPMGDDNNFQADATTGSDGLPADTGGALMYADGDSWEKVTHDKIDDIGGDKITQVDGNQYSQVNGNDWKYVCGTSTNTYEGDVSNDYKSDVTNHYEATYTGTYDGFVNNTYNDNVQATYNASYESYTFGNTLKTMIGFTEDIHYGAKGSLVLLEEFKSNIGFYQQVNLAGLFKYTLGFDSAILTGDKSEVITGATQKVVVGNQGNFYTGNVETFMAGAIEALQVGAKVDVRVGVVTTVTSVAKVDIQPTKVDISTNKIEGSSLSNLKLNGTAATIDEIDTKIAGMGSILRGLSMYL